MRHIGKINLLLIQKKWPNANTDVVLTDERLFHILERHEADFILLSDYIETVIENPNYILEDKKNEDTAIFIGDVSDTNLSVVIKLAFSQQTDGVFSSVITMYQCGNKRLQRLVKYYPVLYKRE